MNGQEKMRNGRWPGFLVVAAGVFLSTLDSSMVNIALPRIMDSFASSLRATEWVVLGYLLVVTSTLLFWGYLSDWLGRRQVYAAGLLLFASGSLGCFFSPAFWALVAARFLQAIGAAMMMSTGPAVIREIFPAEQLGRALGLVGVAVSLGLMAGPVAGGTLLHFFSWRALFLCSVPIAILFFFLARRFIPRQDLARGNFVVDWPGSVVWAVAIGALALSLNYASSPAWSGLVLAAGLSFSAAAMWLFFRIERFALQPVLPIDLLLERYFWTAMLCAVVAFMVLFTAIMLTPFYLDRILGLPPLRIGLTMTAIPVAAMLVAPAAGALSDRIGCRFLTSGGLFLSAAGLFSLAFLDAATAPLAVAARLLLIGAGQAMFLSPNSSLVLGRTRERQVATASALLATARNLGMLLGLSLAGMLFALVFGRLSGGLDLKDFTVANQGAFLVAMRFTFMAAAFTSAAGAVLAWRR